MRGYGNVDFSFSLCAGSVSSNVCIFFVAPTIAGQLLLGNPGFEAGVFVMYWCIIHDRETSQLKTTKILSHTVPEV